MTSETTTTVTMTKEEIVEAIRKETSLYPGSWDDGCNKCAVGAVLWGRVPRGSLDRIADNLSTRFGTCAAIDPGEEKELVKNSPFSALSREFESAFEYAYDELDLPSDECVEKARDAAIDLVQEYFPPTISFQHNGTAIWVTK